MKRIILTLIALALIPSVASAATLFDGLVAHYSFDGNANDRSGNGNDGEVHGAKPIADRFGNANAAYYFGGYSAKSYIEVPSSDSLNDDTGARTISAWVRPDAVEYARGTVRTDGVEWLASIICKGSQFVRQYGLQIGNNGECGWTYMSRPEIAWVYARPQIGEWSHVCITDDGETAVAYVNGVEVARSAVGDRSSATAHPLYIGYDPYGKGVYMRGGLDDVRIYSRALSAAEVRTLWDGFACTQYTFNTSPTTIDEAEAFIKDASKREGDSVLQSYPTIAFADNPARENTVSFPGNQQGKASYFAMTASGKIVVPRAGKWTFACGSDDGFRLRLSGHGFADSAEYSGERSYAISLKTFDFPAAGTYDLDLLYFEWGGTAACELSVARGAYSSFDEDAFALVGTEESGITRDGGDNPPAYCEVTFATNDGTASSWSRGIEIGERVGALPSATRSGYEFLGWFTEAVGGEQVQAGTAVTADVTWHAHWQVIVYDIAYSGLNGASNPNPTVYTVEDTVLFEALADTEERKFVGWSIPGIVRGTTGNLTVKALWDGGNVPTIAPDDGGEPIDASIANTYDGVIVDTDGLPLGYVNVKAAKATGKDDSKTSKVTVTLQLSGEARQLTVKASVSAEDATLSQTTSDGRLLELTLSHDALKGTFDGHEIDGARNLLVSTAKSDRGSDAKKRAETVFAALKGNYSLAFRDANGWNGLSVSVIAKGKVKVSGKLADGTSVTASSQLIVGGDNSVIPVIYTKGAKSFAFNVYFDNDSGETTIFGGDEVEFAPVSGLSSGLRFRLDDAIRDWFGEDYELCDDLLPWEISVEPVSATKWQVDASSNLSGLKLSCAAKTGLFTGSFKVYAVDAKGKQKTFTATVSGAVVDGLGYGAATIKGRGCCAIEIAE